MDAQSLALMGFANYAKGGTTYIKGAAYFLYKLSRYSED
jgi:hypothetical protein